MIPLWVEVAGGGLSLLTRGLWSLWATLLELLEGCQTHLSPPFASVFRIAGRGVRFTSVSLSKENCKRVDRNRRQKEKDVGGVALQSFANQAEKSCRSRRAKISPSQILPTPIASASKTPTYFGSREKGERAGQQTKKGDQCEAHFWPTQTCSISSSQAIP